MVVCGGDLGILVVVAVVVVVEAVDPSYLDLVLGLTCMVVLVYGRRHLWAMSLGRWMVRIRVHILTIV